MNVDFKNNDSFFEFEIIILSRSKHDLHTSIRATNTILTLSTCYDDKVVLHDKLIKKITSCYFFLYL